MKKNNTPSFENTGMRVYIYNQYLSDAHFFDSERRDILEEGVEECIFYYQNRVLCPIKLYVIKFYSSRT